LDNPLLVPDITKVVSVFGFFFDPQGKLLTIVNQRGIDIPGGHVEPEDQNVFDTIKREAMEEAGAVVSQLQLLKTIIATEGKYQGKHMVFVTGKVISHTSTLMTPGEFLSRYTQDKELMTALIQLI
jgi:8-oxo-dGTP pyrophosphatase MutT (NUDIX family)